MKTLVLSMISIAATVAAMTACTSEGDPIDEINPKGTENVEIKLKAGVVDVVTKADPTGANGTEFATSVPIQLYRWDATEKPATLGWASATPVAATATGTQISFGEKQYYNSNGDNTYFLGYYPNTGTLNTENGTISFTGVNGTVDILSAQLIDAGSKASTTTAANIQFKHMLSQVKIKLIGDKVAETTFGKIQKVTLNNIPQNLTMTFGNQGSNATIVPSSAEEKGNIDLLNENEEVDLSKDGQIRTAMIVPTLGGTDSQLTITIETENFKGENSLSITVNNFGNDGMQTGTTNNIDLTFKDKISVTTSIEEWGTGETVTGEIEPK